MPDEAAGGAEPDCTEPDHMEPDYAGPGHAGTDHARPGKPDGTAPEKTAPKRQYSSTVEKGTEFELQVAGLLKAYGYAVTHNVTLTGKSGNAHQIDVLAEYACPLHTSRLIVEAKAYEHHVGKDVVMKLVSIRADLGMDRAVLATTTGFAAGALIEARQHGNLDMWDGDAINKFMAKRGVDARDTGIKGTARRFVLGKMTTRRVRRRAAKSAKSRSGGRIFGRGRPKEHVALAEPVLYPYLDVSVQTRVTKIEKTGWRRRGPVTRTVVNHVTLDGRTGVLVDAAKGALSYRHSYLGALGKDELAILRRVAGCRAFGRDEMVDAGLSPAEANTALLNLARRGTVRQVGEEPARYALREPFPASPGAVAGIEMPHGRSMTDVNPGNRMIDVRVQAGSIQEMLERYWGRCTVVSVEQVYYPYYDVRYEASDGSRRNEVIDGITGRPQEYLADVMAE